MDLSHARRLAEQWSRNAAEISLKRIGNSAPSRKSDSSVVTATDHAIQDFITREIGRMFPDHAICAEESDPGSHSRVAPEENRYCWVLDPLDGTRNYVARVPCFSTSIALLDRGVPIMGVIHEHNTGMLFSATLGGGAFVNGTPARVSELDEHSEHLLGVPSTKDDMAIRVSAHWHATPSFVCRNLGSTAFEMGLIACGAMSGMLGRRVKIWDIAAGAILIMEAGGVVSDPSGKPLIPFPIDADPLRNIPMLAATSRMHDALLESIRTALS